MQRFKSAQCNVYTTTTTSVVWVRAGRLTRARWCPKSHANVMVKVVTGCTIAAHMNQVIDCRHCVMIGCTNFNQVTVLIQTLQSYMNQWGCIYPMQLHQHHRPGHPIGARTSRTKGAVVNNWWCVQRLGDKLRFRINTRKLDCFGQGFVAPLPKLEISQDICTIAHAY